MPNNNSRNALIMAGLKKALLEGIQLSQEIHSFEVKKMTIRTAILEDGDGTKIVAGVDDDHVYILSTPELNKIATCNVNGRPHDLVVGDISGTGIPDIIVGSYDGHVYVFPNTGGAPIAVRNLKSKVEGVELIHFENSPEKFIAAITNTGFLHLLKLNKLPGGRYELETFEKINFDHSLLRISKEVNRQILEEKLVIGGKENGIRKYSKTDGKEEFLGIGRDISAIAALETDNDSLLLLGSGKPAIHCVDKEGNIKWEYDLYDHNARVFTVLTAHKNGGETKIIAGSGNGYVYLLNMDGSLDWKFYVGNRIRDLSVLSFDDTGLKIVIALEGKKILCYELKPYENSRKEILELYGSGGFSRKELSVLSKREMSLLEGFDGLPKSYQEKKMPKINYDNFPNKPTTIDDTKQSLCFYAQLQYVPFSYQWEFECKDWVMAVHTAFIDQESMPTLFIGDRNGYFYILDQNGNKIHEKVLRNNDDIRAIRTISNRIRADTAIIVGTEDGNIMGFNENLTESFNEIPVQRHVRDLCIIEKDFSSKIFLAPYSKNIVLINELGITQGFFSFQSDITTVDYFPGDSQNPAIIIAGADDGMIYAIDEEGKRLWELKSGMLRVKKVRTYSDGENKEIIVVGNSDRENPENTFILDEKGNIKWMYETGGWNLSAAISDLNGNGRNERIVVSGDQNIYFFTEEGDLICKMPTDAWGRDIATFNFTEPEPNRISPHILLGIEDHFAYSYRMLTVPEKEYLQTGLDKCWQQLLRLNAQADEASLIKALLKDENPFLRGQAVLKIDKLLDKEQVFLLLEDMSYDESVYVRIQCVNVLSNAKQISEGQRLEIILNLIQDKHKEEFKEVFIKIAKKLSQFDLSYFSKKQIIETLILTEDSLIIRELIPFILDNVHEVGTWLIVVLKKVLSFKSAIIQFDIDRYLNNPSKEKLKEIFASVFSDGLQTAIHEDDYLYKVTSIADKITSSLPTFKGINSIKNEGNNNVILQDINYSSIYINFDSREELIQLKKQLKDQHQEILLLLQQFSLVEEFRKFQSIIDESN